MKSRIKYGNPSERLERYIGDKTTKDYFNRIKANNYNQLKAIYACVCLCEDYATHLLMVGQQEIRQKRDK